VVPNFPKLDSFIVKSYDSEKEMCPLPPAVNYKMEPMNLPLSGVEIVAKYGNLLSEFEKVEVVEYDYVYFVGHKAKKLMGD
jgi:hypothetical protein